MRYDDIISELAIKENISKEEVNREMSAALSDAGIECSVEYFVFEVAKYLRYYI